jgi:hypothetical protein
MNTGVVDLIYVDPLANITPTDVPGIVVDNGADKVHKNHFHVRLRDTDGPDSNNCL